MNFWSGETLKDRLPQILGKYYDENRIDCAAYRLCIGEEVYISPREGEDPTRTKVVLKPAEAFTIPAGQFAFLLTEEVVSVPPNALGFISVRAKIKFRGLVNISGFHVDPGYRGRLVFSVFNASPAPVHLQRGQPIFLLWLCDLDRESKIIRKPDDGYYDIPVDIINPIAGEVQSLAGLAKKISDTERELSDKFAEMDKRVDERVHRIQQDHTYIKTGLGIALGLLIFIASRLLYTWVDRLMEPSPQGAISVPTAPAPTPGPSPTLTPAPTPQPDAGRGAPPNSPSNQGRGRQ